MRLSVLVETSEGALLPVDSSTRVEAHTARRDLAIRDPAARDPAARDPAARDRDPEIRDVVTTDLLDPSRYLSGGELVLTGLAWWRARQPGRTTQFVAALVRAGVIALGAGEAELGKIPDDLIAACAAAGLPLLRVPVAVSFATVTERATRHLSAYRSGDLAAVLGRRRALVAAALGAADGWGESVSAKRSVESSGLPGILDLVAGDLALPCWVLSATGRLLAGVAPQPGEAERRLLARRFLAARRFPDRVVRPGQRSVSLLCAGPQRPRLSSWVLAVGGDHRDWGDVGHRVVAELLALVALERELATTRADSAAPVALALARGASPAEVAAELRRCGLDPKVSSLVVLADGAHAAAVLREAVTPEEGCAAFGEVDGSALAVLRGQPSPGGVVDRLREVVEFFGPSLGPQRLVVGVSDPVTGVTGLIAGAAQARAAALTTEPTTTHAVAGPDRLGSHALLLAALPAELRRAYRARVLGPILEHDRTHRTDLVPTLRAYLACSGSWTQCAAALHVHVNTLRYRVERIEALTGRDLRRLDDQADLLVALRLPEG